MLYYTYHILSQYDTGYFLILQLNTFISFPYVVGSCARAGWIAITITISPNVSQLLKSKN